MTKQQNVLDASCIIGEEGAAVCMVWLPKELENTTFVSIGYENDVGVYLNGADGSTLGIGDTMSPEDFDVESAKPVFRLHQFDSEGNRVSEYDITAIPRTQTMGFGV